MRFLQRSAAAALGVLLLSGLFAYNASAQTIDRYVIGNGATAIYDGSGNPVLRGTIGQSVVGVSGYEASGTDLYHGFWYLPSKTNSVNTVVVSTGAEHLWNSPNPFTSSTVIYYEVPSRSLVRVRVYDMSGNLVKTLVDGNIAAGRQQVMWNGQTESGDAASTGYYFYSADIQPSDGGDPVSYRRQMLLMK